MSVDVRSFVVSARDTPSALADLADQLDRSGLTADLAFVFYGEQHDDTAIARFFAARMPHVPVVGGTSARGLMSPAGLADGCAVGVLLISDPDGRYGAAGARFGPPPAGPAGSAAPTDGTDPADAAEAALHAALAAADGTGELPELIWLYQSPGDEESVLAGVRRVVGDRCPIIGGSAAADDLAGRWRQLGPDGVMTSGVVVAVLFPSAGVSVAYQGGFEPTGDSGVVTGTGGDDGSMPGRGRRIRRIDGEPAAAVYDRWLGGALPADIVAAGGSILGPGRGFALGVAAGTASGITYFRLIQPGSVDPDGGLVTFADVHQGTRVFGMRGSKEGLVRRAARVVSSALTGLGGDGRTAAGGLVFYCAGCREAVGEDIDRVAATLRAGFGGRDFLGSFTNGEQGPLLERNVHSNLMITALVFGR